MEQFEKVCKGLECCEKDVQLCYGETVCEYYSLSPRCWTTLAHDALTLIRQQRERIAELEAGKTARVLTLEELKDSEVVYLEDFSDPDDFVEPIIRPAVNVEAKNGGIVMLDSVAWDEGFIFVVDSEYGKTWRCWTQRPTDAERKTVKWDK